MTDRETFVRAVCAVPGDDTPRLIFADWLEEHGETSRAEHIRWAVANPQNSAVCLCRCRGREPNSCETCRMMGDEVANVPRRVDGETHYVLNRGFVREVRCSAADWLNTADLLFWHPDQTVPCPECGHTAIRGEVLTHDSPTPGRPDGSWSPKPCPTCSGKGAIDDGGNTKNRSPRGGPVSGDDTGIRGTRGGLGAPAPGRVSAGGTRGDGSTPQTVHAGPRLKLVGSGRVSRPFPTGAGRTVECKKCEGTTLVYLRDAAGRRFGGGASTWSGPTRGGWPVKDCPRCRDESGTPTGRVPAPVALPHPIEEVQLTTTDWLAWAINANTLPTFGGDGTFTDPRWPGILFHTPGGHRPA